MADKKRGLGRGFESLIPTQLVEEEFDVTAQTSEATGQRTSLDSIREVDPALVMPNPHQPRTEFDPVQLEELTMSVKTHGILQPLIVTAQGARYELIAGERRLRAAKEAGLATVPVIVRSYDEQSKLELALIENLQRTDLNAIETATAYAKLANQFNLSNEEIGQRVGKDRSTVANTIRLLALPIEAKRALISGQINETVARTLLTMPTPERQLELLALVIKHKWSAAKAMSYAQGLKNEGTHTAAKQRIAKTSPVTRSLADYLGTKVTLAKTAKGGKLMIEYYSEEELDRIYRAIRGDDDTVKY
jgi:ParB family chromosome partitioning protein